MPLRENGRVLCALLPANESIDQMLVSWRAAAAVALNLNNAKLLVNALPEPSSEEAEGLPRTMLAALRQQVDQTRTSSYNVYLGSELAERLSTNDDRFDVIRLSLPWQPVQPLIHGSI